MFARKQVWGGTRTLSLGNIEQLERTNQEDKIVIIRLAPALKSTVPDHTPSQLAFRQDGTGAVQQTSKPNSWAQQEGLISLTNTPAMAPSHYPVLSSSMLDVIEDYRIQDFPPVCHRKAEKGGEKNLLSPTFFGWALSILRQPEKPNSASFKLHQLSQSSGRILKQAP